MGKQALIFVGFFVIGNILALRYGPFYGLISYIHIYYNIPNHQYWAGQVPAIRWSYICAMLLILSCFIHRDKLTTNPLPKTFYILTGFFFLVIFTALNSPFPEVASKYIYDFMRYVIIFVLTIKIINSLKQYKYVALLFLFEAFNICLLGRHQFKGGRLDSIGIVDAGSSNQFSGLLVMLMPFLYSLYLCENRYFKFACLLFAPFILDVFIMCGSRGAFLGLAGMGIFIFFNSLLIKKIRWKVTIVCVIGVIGLVSLMSEEYKERLFSTTKSDEEQTAAEMSAGRTDVWKVGLEMSKDYPLGAGGGSFLYMSPSYMPENLLEESVGARASHSTYILTLVEQGYLGLFLYCAFLFFSIKMLHDSKKKLIRISKETDATEITNEHLITYCIGLQASIISLVITSAFADRLYYEMLYLICAMAACLSNICENHIVENHNNHAIVET